MRSASDESRITPGRSPERPGVGKKRSRRRARRLLLFFEFYIKDLHPRQSFNLAPTLINGVEVAAIAALLIDFRLVVRVTTALVFDHFIHAPALGQGADLLLDLPR